MQTYIINSLTVNLKVGDITKETTEAIVNAANRELIPGGGVDGAINRAAGPQLGVAQQSLGPIKTGAAVITPGYNLPAKYVIHTAGPIWHGGSQKEEELLGAAYINSLTLASSHRLTSISFPSISTGVYRFPLERAAEIVLESLQKFSVASGSLQIVNLVNFDMQTDEIYRRIFAAHTNN